MHLPKRTETSLITRSDQSGPNHHLLQLCMARTAWSESDQAVRAVHSCNSWLLALVRHGCSRSAFMSIFVLFLSILFYIFVQYII